MASVVMLAGPDLPATQIIEMAVHFVPASTTEKNPPEGGRFIAVTGLLHDRRAQASASTGKWAVAAINRDVFGGDRAYYGIQ